MGLCCDWIRLQRADTARHHQQIRRLERERLWDQAVLLRLEALFVRLEEASACTSLLTLLGSLAKRGREKPPILTIHTAFSGEYAS